MKKLLSLGVTLLIPVSALVAAPPATSDAQALEDHMRQVRSDLVRKRESAFQTLLTLDEAQSKTFRSLVKSYDDEAQALGRKDWELLREFGQAFDRLDPATAEKIAERSFANQRAWLDMQQKYFKQIAEQVSPVVAVQFLQLERRYEAQAITERMKYTPLAE